MIWYLARKYVVLVLAILMAPLPTIFGSSLGKTVVQAFFWSGLAAAAATPVCQAGLPPPGADNASTATCGRS